MELGVSHLSILLLNISLTVVQIMPRKRKSVELPLLEDDRRSSSASDGTHSRSKVEAPLASSSDEAPQGPISLIISLFRKDTNLRDPDGIATQSSVYDDANLAEFYRPSPQYENLHRFDPSERWTWAEESRLVRKLDWKVTAFACTVCSDPGGLLDVSSRYRCIRPFLRWTCHERTSSSTSIGFNPDWNMKRHYGVNLRHT